MNSKALIQAVLDGASPEDILESTLFEAKKTFPEFSRLIVLLDKTRKELDDIDADAIKDWNKYVKAVVPDAGEAGEVPLSTRWTKSTFNHDGDPFEDLVETYHEIMSEIARDMSSSIDRLIRFVENTIADLDPKEKEDKAVKKVLKSFIRKLKAYKK